MPATRTGLQEAGPSGFPGLKLGVPYLAFILLWVATAARAFFGYGGHELRFLAYGLQLAFLALGFLPPLLARTAAPLHPLLDVYLGFQSALIAVLLFLPPHLDYFVTLYICLTIQAMSLFSGRRGFWWTAVFCALTVVVLAAAYGSASGILYAPSTVAGCVLVALYIHTVRRVDCERNRGQTLFAELQGAYRELERYAEQAREYAAAEERNRLARELHDSVTQKLFSMTLTAEAARLLHEREPERVAVLLERIQELARESLAEMRALLQKLALAAGTADGLVPALRRQAEERRRRDGLEIELVVEGEPDPPGRVREALFRVAQEALNNVVKHSGAGSARVVLRREGEAVTLLVEDAGRGFRPSDEEGREAGGTARLGLDGMRERVRSLGGSIEIESQPGRGTRVRVVVPGGGSDGG